MNQNPSPDTDLTASGSEQVAIIEPKKGWQLIDFRELRDYRDLFIFLVWRDIKVLYAQTILGFAWAIIQPAVQIVIFSVVFGKVAQIATDGIPYVLYSTAGIIPWTYMSQSIVHSSQSLVTGQGMLGKVYFPRLIFPMTSVLAKLVDFSISLLIIIGVMVYYQVYPTWKILLVPVFVLYMMCISAGAGLWLSAMAIRFRDVKYAMTYLIQMLMYSAPIVYSASTIPHDYRVFYSLNPIVGVIEGFRSCLLGSPLPLGYILPGILTALIIFVGGMFYFKRMERIFVDVI
ncbi:MAG: ABC transporter permease [Desulfosarcinaceae bacterium]|nr:ABC transporter permease [Desulfosarcinaceae bacterium]